MKEKKAKQSMKRKKSINQKHTSNSNVYDEVFADMQALAFVVSGRRMLFIFWLALFVRWLSGGASLLETLNPVLSDGCSPRMQSWDTVVAATLLQSVKVLLRNFHRPHCTLKRGDRVVAISDIVAMGLLQICANSGMAAMGLH
jgi:hypothetical protein